MIGEFLMQGQEEWVPCIFEAATVPGKISTSTWTLRNADDTDINLSYVLPLPTKRGGQRLHISGLTVGVQDASPGNGVIKFQVRGVVFNQATILNGTTYEAGVFTPTNARHMFPTIDCSQFDVVKVVVYLECTTEKSVDISLVTARCYYA